MDAVQIINEKVDVARLLEHYDFDKMRPEGVMIRSCCKLHGGNNPTSFVINAETGLWYCHTGDCGGGDIYTLVQIMEEINFPDAVKWIAEFFQIDISNAEIVARQDHHVKELKAFVKAITSRKKVAMPEYIIPVPVRDVRKFRDFLPETMEHFGLGFIDEITLDKKSGGQYTLHNRLVFPIVQAGRQIGMSLRKTRAQDFPKWSHQPLNIETNELLYNYDAVLGQPRIAIVEGALDVWAYHEIGVPAVATFGAHMTEEQYKLLMRTGADLVFSYDGDEAGRKATDKACDMFRYKANMERVVFGEEEDPESVGRDQLKLKYESRLKLC